MFTVDSKNLSHLINLVLPIVGALSLSAILIALTVKTFNFKIETPVFSVVFSTNNESQTSHPKIK